jgi:hypothetical protein
MKYWRPQLYLGQVRTNWPRNSTCQEPKNAQLPVTYTSNQKAWMTSAIFEEWLRQWDKKLQSENRWILLLLDNFSGHDNVLLKQITVKYFPPNTTSRSFSTKYIFFCCC